MKDSSKPNLGFEELYSLRHEKYVETKSFVNTKEFTATPQYVTVTFKLDPMGPQIAKEFVSS